MGSCRIGRSCPLQSEKFSVSVSVRESVRELLTAFVLAVTLCNVAAAQDVDASRRTAIVRASERIAPAVVSVNVRSRQTVQPRSIFDIFGPSTREVQGLGSGFVIRNDGVVVTNEHVVRGATEVVVTLPDGRDFAADVVGTDDVTDLAVLRLRAPPSNLTVAALGSSANLIIGEWAIAVGNPFGFYLANAEPTVTAGVISAVGRNIIPGGDDNRGYYLDMIQTDASINPGNSGGPLVNAAGEVIGVNASILSATGGSVGLGFAIPIDRARRVVSDLLANGRVRRPWIGVNVEPAAPNSFGHSREVKITNVAPNSPGERAGIRPGEIVTSVNRKPVRNPLDWEARLLDAHVGEPMEITVSGINPAATTKRVTPIDLPSLGAERVSALAGLQLITLTPAIRAERGVTSENGALIVSLTDEARSVGLTEGDVIVAINRQPINTAAEAAKAMRDLPRGSAIRMTLERQGRVGSIAFYKGS